GLGVDALLVDHQAVLRVQVHHGLSSRTGKKKGADCSERRPVRLTLRVTTRGSVGDRVRLHHSRRHAGADYSSYAGLPSAGTREGPSGCSAERKNAVGCAPDTPCCSSMTKNGTPFTPIAWPRCRSARTS